MNAAVCYLQSFRLDSADADTMNNLGVLLYQVGLIEEAERMFKKGLNLKLYNLQLNYNYLECILFREEYMMAENLLQRLEAFTGKSAILYEKRALLHYKLNRMTLALFDIESALSCDRNHADALYLKGLILLREENFQGAIQCIMEAANIYPEYTGMHFFVSHGEQIKADPLRTNFKMDVEPPEELISLLQTGVNRRFDKIRDDLESVVETGMRYLEGNKSGPAEEAPDAPDMPDVSKDQAEPQADIDDSIDLLSDLDLKV
jgi:tetratricopeptide (TPR) repeat protein